MSIIAWVLFGLVAGFIGGKLVNSTGSGVWRDGALGIAGAVLGGLVFQRVGAAHATGFNLLSLFVAVCGACLVLFVYHAVSGYRPPATRLSMTERAAGRASTQSPSR
jgi:uncharacterized membrane protein YeaQ/YmgE (transglycosylase-associated protein family)